MRVRLRIILLSSQVKCVLFHFSLFPLLFQYPQTQPRSPLMVWTTKLKYYLKINLVPRSKALHLYHSDRLSNILSIISNYSRYSFPDKLWDVENKMLQT